MIFRGSLWRLQLLTQFNLALSEYLVKIRKICQLGTCKIGKIHTDYGTDIRLKK